VGELTSTRVCSRCGRRPAVEGRYSCEPCIAVIQERAEAAKRRQRQTLGECARCGEPVSEPSHRYCDECRKLRSKNCRRCAKMVIEPDADAFCPECREARYAVPEVRA
jgi:hypothetical protein